VELEKLLTAEAQKREPRTDVTISHDGLFAIYRVGDRYTLRKLSEAARKFLSKGGLIPTVESLFES
jgi:hypothetical protein